MARCGYAMDGDFRKLSTSLKNEGSWSGSEDESQTTDFLTREELLKYLASPKRAQHLVYNQVSLYKQKNEAIEREKAQNSSKEKANVSRD